MFTGVVRFEEMSSFGVYVVSNLLDVLSKISANYWSACMCLPLSTPGLAMILFTAAIRSAAIHTALSIDVFFGISTWVGYKLYCPDVLYPPVAGI